MPGMHGNYTAVTAMQKTPTCWSRSARAFDDRVTGKLAAFAPHAKVIHVDIDPAEIGKNRVADVPIVGDCKDVIGKLAAELHKRQDEARRRPTAARGWGSCASGRTSTRTATDRTTGR